MTLWWKQPLIFARSDFAAQQRLRELIFWADNVDDDTVPSASIQAGVGM